MVRFEHINISYNTLVFEKLLRGEELILPVLFFPIFGWQFSGLFLKSCIKAGAVAETTVEGNTFDGLTGAVHFFEQTNGMFNTVLIDELGEVHSCTGIDYHGDNVG
jgi:hypothetical protein